MPFEKQEIQPYIKEWIEKRVRENQMGVYGLFKEGMWVYVGSGDIRDRLLDHLDEKNEKNKCIIAEAPTNFMVEVTSDYENREIELIQELEPECNIQHKQAN